MKLILIACLLCLAGCKHYHCPVAEQPYTCVTYIMIGKILIPQYHTCYECPVEEVETKQ